MEYKEVKKIIEDMENSKLTELSIEFPEGLKISMKKDSGKKAPVPMVSEISQPPMNIIQAQVPIEVKSQEKKVDGNIVKSPMVGTFYSKPSPKSDSFVKKGSKVKKGDTLCIIEAMKLMNEIESEYDGEIIEILVKDEEMVEYGQPLFVVK